ncbi:MAG: leucyl aminopeptidase [Geodermatophilaceae bacterium]|nr:leucyl aminopeptidase [Geodermatophilaceae bacterium]
MVTALTLTDTDLADLTADAVVIGLLNGEGGPSLAPGAEAVDVALGGRLLDALVALGASGAEDEVVKLATLGAMKTPVIAAAGLGRHDGAVTEEAVRRAAGAASRALGGRATVASTLALVNGEPTPGMVQAAGEGSLLGAYSFSVYKSKPAPAHRQPPSAVQLVVPSAKDRATKATAKRASAIADAVALCRDLINTPPNDLFPAEFAARAERAGGKAGLDVEVFDEKALKKGGYGGILGVGMGSSRPPRLVRMSYRGRGAKTKIALVGKGITFDTGGISIKPAAAMENMKSDMSGAAAIVSTMTLIAALKLPVDVVATVPMAENMPGSTAYRPADVLTFRNGTKAEILNTDAEGRVILADAIARACEDSPAYLIETSTLTGAQVVALGNRTAGVMGSDDFRERVIAAGRRSGEGMWGMPLPPEVRKGLDSAVADFANVGDRSGGMLAGGHFLAEFVTEGIQWAHIDIAGPAYNTGSPWGYNLKGGTGVPVRTLLELIEDIAGNG